MKKKTKADNLIQRLYRVSRLQDNHVKKQARKAGGESAYIRNLIDMDCAEKCPK